MGYQVIYRAFRPEVFGELYGQETIARVLKRQIETGHVAHAYLFCGTRGTGKTTTAKIFARAVNCLAPEDGEPCGHCEACESLSRANSMDVIEIDAASNNGVDEIRDLREKIKYPPSVGKYKVYIVDEVHMLSSGAFNALLKTLEEPPAHAIFILATTEPQRLPATILSRCQRFDFRRVSMADICACMRNILEKIGRTAEDEALSVIAASAEGAVRDALSLLDTCLSYADGTLTAAIVRDVTGTAGRAFLFDYADALIAGDAARAISLMDALMREGRDLAVFLREAASHLRALLLAKVAPKGLAELLEVSGEDERRYLAQAENISAERLSYMLDLYLEAEPRMKWLSSARAAAELCAVRACRPQEAEGLEGLLARLDALERRPAPNPSPAPEAPAPKAPKEEAPAKRSEAAPAKAEGEGRREPPKGAPEPAEYRQALAKLSAEMPMIARHLEAMKFARMEGDAITVEFARAAAMQMSLLERKKDVLESALGEAFGRRIALSLRRADDKPAPVATPVRKQIADAQDFFGRENVEIVD